MIGFIRSKISDIKIIFWRLKMMKDVYPWDMVNSHEIIFRLFQDFSKRYGEWKDRVENYSTDSDFFENIPKNIVEETIRDYTRLIELLEYVNVPRVENRKLLDNLLEEYSRSYETKTIPCEENPDFYQVEFDIFYYLDVDYDIDNKGKLTINFTMTKEDKSSVYFDIDDHLVNLDIDMAIEILELGHMISG